MGQLFANILALPFVAGALLFLYLTWTHDIDLAPWMIPFVLMAAVIYIFSPQINWWWYSRRPPELPDGLRQLLERFSGFYRRLDTAGKKKFRDRVALYTMATDWTPTAWPEDVLPPDVQFVLATQAVTLTFHRPEFLLEKFEKIIVYPFPFPSPEYQFAHASELFEPDGCLLFSAEQVMKAFVEPAAWYNVGLHEFAKAYALSYPADAFPDLSEPEAWQHLETISGMSRDHVEAVIGLAGVEPLPVAIHHYFTFPQRFKDVWPEKAAALERVFA
ncbi:MAG: zinc-dependent peptidase [Saprospiraceae bacterium]|nr:zinc-dependent peptidase [Saprospiraceae bacterium]